ncbi:hypothetical protein QS306_15050 [Paraburkholderia bonniea]|uniref:hypothetical protein n=1 Tax=Paraburkholderia bonniea TaxID=2152891 RepID=UPI0025745580|nr:hypothetical protein [Paraburkholderia bonniea]WJF92076.1 hypothetical protein QS306_15050 [Paraburkholderia bonniea]WJF95396.1 hypothetical protein QS308_15055 [Paraburkholderia bonniea]
MAVDFSLLPTVEPRQDTAPSRIVWSVTFVVMYLAGVLGVLFFWPKGMPTHTWQFWTSLVLFPAGIPGWLVLRRYSAYEGRKLNAILDDEAAQRYNARVFEAASIPLALLGSAHRFSADRTINTPGSIRTGKVVLKTQDPIASNGEPVKARWLIVPGMRTTSGSNEDERHRRRHVTTWLFDELLDELLLPIRTLPARLDLSVQLCIANGLTHQENEALWQACWHARSLRKMTLAPMAEPPADLITLDRWMDQIPGQVNVHATLMIAVQLHPLLAGTPPSGHSEAGVALLLVPDILVRQHRIPHRTTLHRPVRGSLAQPGEALAHALQWADVTARHIATGWQTGLKANKTISLYEPSGKLGQGLDLTALDQTVGYAGIAAPWLAVACAAASRHADSAAQIILAGQHSHVDCAVVKHAPEALIADGLPDGLRPACSSATSPGPIKPSNL